MIYQTKFTKSRYFCSFTHQLYFIVDPVEPFVMDDTIRSEDLRLIRRISFSGIVGDLSARLFNDQKSCCAVPRLQFMFKETIKPSGSYPAKVHGCRSEATNRNSFAYKSVEHIKWSIGHIEIGVGKACYET